MQTRSLSGSALLFAFTTAFPLFAQTPVTESELPPPAEPSSPVPPEPTESPASPAVPSEPAPVQAPEPALAPAPPPIAEEPEPAPPPFVAPPEASEAPAPKKWKRFSIASEDGAHKLDVRGFVHVDARFFPDGDNRNTFLVRRARPSIDAVVYKYFELRILPDFAGSRLSLLDAYVNFHFIDAVQLRVGKGKVPVGLERLQAISDPALVELAFPTALVPNRDVGVQLHGALLDGAIDWAVGVYNGVPNGQSGESDANDSKDYVGRIFAHPFRPLDIDALKELGLGFAANYGDQSGPLPQYRTPGQSTFFSYVSTASAAGKRTILSPQAYYYGGPLGLLGEYVHVSERVTNGDATETLEHQAFQVTGSVAIGGRPSYKGVSPDHPFDPEEGGYGALELAGRYTEIRFDSDTFSEGLADSASAARRASAWAIGANWYFAPKVRLQVNYERTTFRGGDAEGNRPAESLLVSRVQLAF